MLLDKQTVHDKKLLKLQKRLNTVYQEFDKSAVYIPLEKPIHNGYYIYLTLIDDFNSQDNEALKYLIEFISDRFWVENKKDYNKKYKMIQGPSNFASYREELRPNLNTYTLQIRYDLSEVEYNEITQKYSNLGRYIKGPFEYKNPTKHNRKYYLIDNISKGMLQKKVEKAYIYGHYQYDDSLRSERELLNQYLWENRKNGGRLHKLVCGSSPKYSWKDLDRKINRIQNKDFAKQELNQYLVDQLEEVS